MIKASLRKKLAAFSHEKKFHRIVWQGPKYISWKYRRFFVLNKFSEDLKWNGKKLCRYEYKKDVLKSSQYIIPCRKVINETVNTW